MHPILFKIPLFGGLTIFTYGALVALAFIAGIIYISKEARRVGEDPGKALDLVFWVILGAIIGSRIYYVVTTEPQTILEDPLTIFKIWRAGLVFQGGVLFAFIIGLWWIRKHKLPFWKYADIFAPAIALGHVFGRMGCLMSGCCHGREAPLGVWYAITFPVSANSWAPGGMPLYPTQIMESLGELIIFLGLFFFRKHKKFDGQIMAIWLMCYAVLRFIVEFFRGAETREFVYGWISTAQVVAIVMFMFGIIIWARNRRRT